MTDEERADHFKYYFVDKYSVVGDLSSHPITPSMKAFEVNEHHVSWMEPGTEGIRTPYSYDRISDREGVKDLLQQYVDRGYLREIDRTIPVWLSPLLPLKKQDGSWQFVNDYRRTNAYFSKMGIQQIDVERCLRDIPSSW